MAAPDARIVCCIAGRADRRHSVVRDPGISRNSRNYAGDRPIVHESAAGIRRGSANFKNAFPRPPARGSDAPLRASRDADAIAALRHLDRRPVQPLADHRRESRRRSRARRGRRTRAPAAPGTPESQPSSAPWSPCAESPPIVCTDARTGDVFAEQAHARGAVDDLAPERPGRLEAGEHDRAFVARQVVAQVVPDAPAFAHARRPRR